MSCHCDGEDQRVRKIHGDATGRVERIRKPLTDKQSFCQYGEDLLELEFLTRLHGYDVTDKTWKGPVKREPLVTDR
jgi:hypothetical protein